MDLPTAAEVSEETDQPTETPTVDEDDVRSSTSTDVDGSNKPSLYEMNMSKFKAMLSEVGDDKWGMEWVSCALTTMHNDFRKAVGEKYGDREGNGPLRDPPGRPVRKVIRSSDAKRKLFRHEHILKRFRRIKDVTGKAKGRKKIVTKKVGQ